MLNFAARCYKESRSNFRGEDYYHGDDGSQKRLHEVMHLTFQAVAGATRF